MTGAKGADLILTLMSFSAKSAGSVFKVFKCLHTYVPAALRPCDNLNT